MSKTKPRVQRFTVRRASLQTTATRRACSDSALRPGFRRRCLRLGRLSLRRQRRRRRCPRALRRRYRRRSRRPFRRRRRWARPRCHHHSRLRRRRSTAATPHRFTDCCLKMPAAMDGRARRISFTTRHPLVSLRPTTQTLYPRAHWPRARPSGSISAFPKAAMRSCWAGGARTASSVLSLWTSMAGIFKT